MAEQGAPKPTVRVLLLGNLADSVWRFRGPLLTEMRARGLEVHAAAPGLTESTEAARSLRAIGVHLHDLNFARTGMNPLSDLGLLLRLLGLLRQVRPTHVLAYTIKPVTFGLLASKLAGVRQRVALINGLGFAFSDARGWKRRFAHGIASALYRLALSCASRAYFQNPDDRDLFVRKGLLPRRLPVQVVNGSGVCLEAFAPSPLPEGPLQCVLIARLLGQKGIREYAAAAQALREAGAELRCHLVGGLDANPDSIGASELEAWEQAGILEYHGSVSDVRPLLRASHVFVLPSYYREGVPRTILEAMAMGRAIITCDAPGCRETVQQGRNGFLIEPRSAPALMAAMQSFLDDPSLAAKMGAKSLALARDKYDVRKINAIMLEGMGL